jgi:hypothetical protein
MIYMTIEHWEDFKRASGRSYKFSNEGFQVLFQHFYEQNEWYYEGVEIHYDLFNFIEEYDSAIQAIPDEVYHEIKMALWRVSAGHDDIDEIEDDVHEPSDDIIEPQALTWLYTHYETVLELPCCGGVIVFHDTKKY